MKILESNYNNGHSTIVIQTASGQFMGQARVHPEDKDVESRIIGWKIAEQRALISYYKDKIKKEKNIIKGIYELTYRFDPFDLPIARRAARDLIYQHNNQIKSWEISIQESKDIIKEIFEGIEKTKMVIKRKEKSE